MRTRVVLLTLTVALGLSLAVMVLWFQPLARSAAAAWVRTLGVSEFRFARLDPSFSGATLSDVRAEYAFAPWRAHVRADQISISYDIISLLSGTARPSVRATKGNLEIQESGGNTQSHARKEGAFVLDDFFASIPLATLSIQELFIRHLNWPPFTLTAELLNSNLPSLHASATAGSLGSMELSLSKSSLGYQFESTGAMTLPSVPRADWKIKGLVVEQELKVFPDSVFNLAPLDVGAGELQAFSLTAREPVRFNLASQELSGEVALSDLKFDSAGSHVSATAPRVAVELPSSEKNTPWNATIISDRVTFSMPGYHSPQCEVSGNVRGNSDSVSLKLMCAIPEVSKPMQISGTYAPKTQEGTLTVTLPTITFTPEKPLSSFHPSWSLPFDISRGMSKGQGKFLFGSASAGAQSTVELRHAWLEIGGVTISDVNASGTIVPFPVLRTLRPLEISAAEVGLPIPLRTVTLSGRILSESHIEIPTARAELLGGTLTLSAAMLNLKPFRLAAKFEISNLSLESVLDLYPQESLHATGSFNVSGEVLGDERGFSGRITSLTSTPEGGTIQYVPESSQATTGPLSYAIEPLQNFVYQEISGTGELKEGGALTLALLLKGRNPKWQQGRPVHLNLTLSENVLELLRSIRLARGEGDEVSKTVRETTGMAVKR